MSKKKQLPGNELRLILESDDLILDNKPVLVKEQFPIIEKYWIDHANICSKCNTFIPISNAADKEYTSKPYLIMNRCANCLVPSCSVHGCVNITMFDVGKCINHLTGINAITSAAVLQ
jgi:hypothetical protein